MKTSKFKLKNSKKGKRVFLIILGVYLFLSILCYAISNYYSNDTALKDGTSKIVTEKSSQVPRWIQEKMKQYEAIRKDPHRINKDWNNNLKITDGNIFYRNQNSEIRQITFKNLSEEAILSPDKKKIAFLRQPTNDSTAECVEEPYGFGGNSWQEIWLYNLITQEEILLTSAKDTCYGYIEKLVFSLDEKKIYFKHSKWVTSSAIEVVDIETKKVTFMGGGNTLEVIREGEYKGNLLVSKHKYHPAPNYGAYTASCIVSPEGEELLEQEK